MECCRALFPLVFDMDRVGPLFEFIPAGSGTAHELDMMRNSMGGKAYVVDLVLTPSHDIRSK